MVASTFGPGSESMRQWGLNQSDQMISKNDVCAVFGRAVFVRGFYGPKSLSSVPRTLPLMRVTYCAITIACQCISSSWFPESRNRVNTLQST